jgi:hypothetical protein
MQPVEGVCQQKQVGWGLVVCAVLCCVWAPTTQADGVFFGGAGLHRARFSLGIGIGLPWPGYYPPAYYYPPPPAYYYPPPAYYPAPSVTYVPAAPPYRYYCPELREYYPIVAECASGWLRVIPE